MHRRATVSSTIFNFLTAGIYNLSLLQGTHHRSLDFNVMLLLFFLSPSIIKVLLKLAKNYKYFFKILTSILLILHPSINFKKKGKKEKKTREKWSFWKLPIWSTNCAWPIAESTIQDQKQHDPWKAKSGPSRTALGHKAVTRRSVFEAAPRRIATASTHACCRCCCRRYAHRFAAVTKPGSRISR